jgi:hypothetical protein
MRKNINCKLFFNNKQTKKIFFFCSQFTLICCIDVFKKKKSAPAKPELQKGPNAVVGWATFEIKKTKLEVKSVLN